MGETTSTRQLAYKCRWYGRNYIEIDRWFPSSKRCSNCGYIAEKMPLNVREWDCPDCGTHHDRDINASKVKTFWPQDLRCQSVERP